MSGSLGSAPLGAVALGEALQLISDGACQTLFLAADSYLAQLPHDRTCAPLANDIYILEV